MSPVATKIFRYWLRLSVLSVCCVLALFGSFFGTYIYCRRRPLSPAVHHRRRFGVVAVFPGRRPQASGPVRRWHKGTEPGRGFDVARETRPANRNGADQQVTQTRGRVPRTPSEYKRHRRSARPAGEGSPLRKTSLSKPSSSFKNGTRLGSFQTV